MEGMKILGIDPGLERVGFGLIECDTQQRYHAIDWGVITTSKKEPEAARLFGIYQALMELIRHHSPDTAAVEKMFFFKNAKTMVPVSQARGVILMTLHESGTSYCEYTPMQVKQNMTGYGKASKEDIQTMVQQLLIMDELPRPDDASDALAIALSCAFEQGPISLSKSQACMT
jgi:crossover junction endodeoxyribonuclease RuvC